MDMTIPNKLRLQVTHLHPDNSDDEQRENSKYKTIARLFDKETDELVHEASSRCCDNDTPDRKRGYQIAVGRVLVPFNKTHVEDTTNE